MDRIHSKWEHHNRNEKKIAIQVVDPAKAHAMNMTNDVRWQWSETKNGAFVTSGYNSANVVKCINIHLK